MKELLTHSRQDAFKSCRRKHWYSYELGMRRTDEARALRMGSAFHAGIEELGKSNGVADACAAVRAYYVHCPEYIDAYEWACECETILRLVCAYQWRWQTHKLEYIETEFAFRLPLVNPETGRASSNFDIAGKIDGIVRLEDGRLAVKETKTTSDDIGHDAPLWRRLRMDHQISLYISAARRMGYAVDTVLYDVVRKPTIQPTSIPIVDADGLKIVLDADGLRVKNANGKSWRQTADKERGYVLQSRQMTPEEWGEKLNSDIGERPDYYFARVEIPRMDQDIDEYQHELWDIQRDMREAQKSGRHYRTVGRNCAFCSYFDVCSTGQQIDPAFPPVGFEIVRDKNPELGGTENVRTTSPASTTESSAAAPAAAG